MDKSKTSTKINVRKSITLYLSILGIIAAILLVWQLRRTPSPPPPFVEPARNPYSQSVAAAGIVEAINENIAIGVPIPGLVADVKVKVWDHVEKDQPLFQLDDRELQAQLLVQEANVKTAEAALARLQDQLARLKSIEDPRAVSVEDVRTRENDVAVATAQLNAAQAQVQQTKLLIERLTVRAPRASTILQTNIRPGEYAQSSPKNPAMILGDLQNLQVRAMVDEQNAPLVQKGRPATAYLKGTTHFPIPLHFVRIEPFIIPKESLTGASNERVDTRVLEIIYTFDQPKNLPIYVGQQVDVFIEARDAK